MNVKNKVCVCLIAIICFFNGLSSFAETSFKENFSATAISYDFVNCFDWGYESSPLYDYWPSENIPRYIDIEYVGMGKSNKMNLFQYPDKWRKGWIRIEISPKHEWTYFEQAERISGIDFSEDLMYGSNMFFSNVQIADNIFFFPKATMIYAAQVDYERKEKNIWYLEFVFKAGDFTETMIEDIIENSTITFDVDYFLSDNGEHIHLDSYALSTKGMKRLRYFEKEKLNFHLVSYEEIELDIVKMSEGRIPYCTLPQERLNDIVQKPDDYVFYQLHINAENKMNWPAVTLFGTLSNEDDYAWLIYNRSDDVFLGYNDVAPNSVATIDDFVLIVHKSRLRETSIKVLFESLGIELLFSTEMAGHLEFGTQEKKIFSGPRFSLPVQIEVE